MQPRLLHQPIRLAGASLLRVQSDARLVVLARDGHDPAFTTIVDRYRGALVRYCTRLLGSARAEDAVQQVLLNAHTTMLKDDRDIDLRPWLYRIAHNVSLNTLRGARETDVLSRERADPASLEDTVADREHLRATLAAISALPEPQRDALVLREIEGRSHEEIAVALGVSVGGARQHLHRARTAVRTAMTAITPYPLLVRLMDVASSSGVAESGAARASEVAVGTGLGAVATKVGVGALAAGALAGGAIHAEHTRRHHHLVPQAHVASPLSVHHAKAATLAPAATAGTAVAALPAASSGQRSDDSATTGTHSRRTSSVTHHKASGGHHSSGSGSSGTSGNDGHTSGGSGSSTSTGPSSGSSSSSSGSSGGHDGSVDNAGSGTAAPTVRPGHHSKGSGDDSSGSGSSSSGSDSSGSGSSADSGSGDDGVSGSKGSGDAPVASPPVPLVGTENVTPPTAPTSGGDDSGDSGHGSRGDHSHDSSGGAVSTDGAGGSGTGD